MPDVDGVKLTDEQVAWLTEMVPLWVAMPGDWGAPARICKAVYDALPAENEQP